MPLYKTNERSAIYNNNSNIILFIVNLRSALMYFPDNCITTSVNGFNEGVIVSQKGDKYEPNVACTMFLSIRGLDPLIKIHFEHIDLVESPSSPAAIAAAALESSSASAAALSPISSITSLTSTPDANDCEDFVQFFDATRRRAPHDGGGLLPLTTPLCGRLLPPDFTVNSGNVSVLFRSDGARQRSGFRFRFSRENDWRRNEVCVAGRGGCVSRLQLARAAKAKKTSQYSSFLYFLCN